MMDSKKRNLKAGNENGVIIAILAILLVLVAAIVGVVVLKDNAPIATFDGGKVTKKEYQVYYEMFSSYLSAYGYDAESIPGEILQKAAQDKMILTDAKAAGVKLSDEDKAEVDEIFNNEEYIEYISAFGDVSFIVLMYLLIESVMEEIDRVESFRVNTKYCESHILLS